MFTDLFGFAIKAQLWSSIFEDKFDKSLPAYRKARIDLANLERLTKKFEREFTSEMLLSVPEKKLRKARGQFKHRVVQQNKAVDKSIRTLIEETAVGDFKSAGVQTVTAKKLRGIVQRYVAQVNREATQKAKKALQQSYEAVVAALSGN